jgi:shikimate kinase
MKTSVALIGFMGTGKTAVGKALAEYTGKDFIELDAVIEKRAGKAITDIFRNDGEIAFRELEIEVTREVAGKKNTVIACGGGLVLNRINIDRLKRECVIIYLTASAGVILRRTSSEAGKRPLLEVADRFQQIKEMLKFRQPFYRRAADIIINTSKMSINTVVRRITEELEDNEDYGR